MGGNAKEKFAPWLFLSDRNDRQEVLVVDYGVVEIRLWVMQGLPSWEVIQAYQQRLVLEIGRGIQSTSPQISAFIPVPR